MKLAKPLMVSAICMAAVALATTPAFAHLWPVFGFNGPGLGFSAATIGNMSLKTGYDWRPLPGTYEWAATPIDIAQPVLPGLAFDGNNSFHGSINFGKFGRGSPGLSSCLNSSKPGGVMKS